MAHRLLYQSALGSTEIKKKRGMAIAGYGLGFKVYDSGFRLWG
jgi:hypothetical protein